MRKLLFSSVEMATLVKLFIILETLPFPIKPLFYFSSQNQRGDEGSHDLPRSPKEEIKYY